MANGTPGGLGQQQATALCDISAQLQQYQQFLGKQHLVVHVSCLRQLFYMGGGGAEVCV